MNGNKRILSALLCMALLLSVFALSAAANELPIVPPHTHTYVYTDNGNGTHTVTCSVSGCTYSATESHTFTNGACVCGATEDTLRIISAYPRIGENVTLIYTASVPSGYSNPYMVFTFLGTSYTVSTYSVNEQGRYCFEMTEISPQYMGENVSAVLHASKNGSDSTDTQSTYSIRQYCVNQLGNNPTAKLKILLSDLLTYGAAAQQYVGYKTNELVTAGLSLTPSTFTGVSGKTVTFSGTADTRMDWRSATLVLRNTLAVRFYFMATDTRSLTIRCTINGRTKDFNSFEYNSANGLYYIDMEDIEATEFDNTVTATFLNRSGEQIGRSASYSVNTYVCNMQNTEDANLRALVRALYNYGAAASNYAK